MIFKNVDFCEAAKGEGDYTLTRSFYELARMIKPDIVHECPYLPGFIRITNISTALVAVETLKYLFRGDFIGIARFYNNDDPSLFEGSLFGTIRCRTGQEF